MDEQEKADKLGTLNKQRAEILKNIKNTEKRIKLSVGINKKGLIKIMGQLRRLLTLKEVEIATLS